jgi:glycosidase
MHPYEFLISLQARKRYGFDQGIFTSNEPLQIADMAIARQFAWQMSRIKGFPIPASGIFALGVIDEIQHILLHHYESENYTNLKTAYQWLIKAYDKTTLPGTQVLFLDEFPPVGIRRQLISVDGFLKSPDNQEMCLEEMYLLHIRNMNPASQDFLDLYDESNLMGSGDYATIIGKVTGYLETGSPEGRRNGNETLLEALMAPALHSPHSLSAQLEYLMQRWGKILGESVIDRIKRSLDMIREELDHDPGPSNGRENTFPMEFTHDKQELENFSPDQDWMPNLTLIAKNCFVWLDQLSKRYQRPITTLNQIPDEELDQLSRSGFSGLWLIGLWERSKASMRIKQMMGNPDAVASAYSLMDYQIDRSLGGWQDLIAFRERAWKRGIRLSADMVPNHMGIDSTWVIDHPDWFLSLPYSPYPNYSFTGPDLSSNNQVGLFLEDHYYDRSDAAVVFKHVEYGSGITRYIYHGNDGTSMPWNDTAQLNYLKAEVREEVIQTILHVARNFPIIRFDAAMTLTSKHIQRLWFPEPGAGGAIPSRTEHGMTRTQFDQALPVEFWREVVDRVAAEEPDTLLLAEAFWLMEGYFTRSLGMHRVYNSAFMHMLRDEDNAKYRTVIKNVLEFDPQILKRFVNFMNNPDEKTAIDQFGEGEKYFGVCTLMVSLPGVPMFGHGQIEGFHEKYGMEYKRAYWDETPNQDLVRAHEWHIFPILKLRYLFADVKLFRLYDFYTEEGVVDENVYAFANGIGDGLADGKSQRSLIIYHNKYAETHGWIKTSAAWMEKSSGKLNRSSLEQALGLRAGRNDFTIFRDLENGLEYIRSSFYLASEGFHLDLKAYQHHTFIDFREVSDHDGKWQAVCNDLKGTGYWSIQARYDEMNASSIPVIEVKPIQKKQKRKKVNEAIDQDSANKSNNETPNKIPH